MRGGKGPSGELSLKAVKSRTAKAASVGGLIRVLAGFRALCPNLNFGAS
jgi:hypothetical protein